MLRRAFSVCAVLGLASVAHAGAVISLVPDVAPGPGGYNPNQVVNVSVMAQLTAGTPSVPGPAGTTTLIRLRYMQLDVTDSSNALGIGVASHHPGSDLGPIPFWDFGGSSACANDETACGGNYFIDGDPSNDVMNITYIGLTSSGSAMITLNQTTPKRVGEFSITMPGEGGEFVLDVLNDDNLDPNLGAEIRWGFGSASDPTDPTSPLRAGSLTAGGGGIVMVSGQENGLPVIVVPEPATLAMLGLGGLAAAFRRRRSA